MQIQNDELLHYGRKGMRWYQHIFGRKSSVDSERTEMNAVKKKRSIKDVSDEELRRATVRNNLESDYIQSLNRRKSLNPKKGENIVKKFFNEEIKGYMMDQGKKALSKFIDKKIEDMVDPEGAAAKREIENLKKQAERYGYMSRIASAKKNIGSYQDWVKSRSR